MLATWLSLCPLCNSRVVRGRQAAFQIAGVDSGFSGHTVGGLELCRAKRPLRTGGLMPMSPVMEGGPQGLPAAQAEAW